MNHLRLPSPRMSNDHMDGILRAFFRSEIPEPWPVLVAPVVPASRLIRPWWKDTGRLVAAASVGIILLGYLTLAGRFPRLPEYREGGVTVVREGISKTNGLKSNRPLRTLTPSGREALIWEHPTGDGGVNLKLQLTDHLKGKR